MSTLVQHTYATGGAQSIVTFVSATTSGNLISVMTEANGGDTISSIADTALNNYTKVAAATSASSQVSELWFSKNITGNASNVVTVTFSGASYHAIYIAEWSGLDTASQPDTNFGSATGTGTAMATGSFGITTGDLVLSIGINASSVGTPGTSFTSIDSDGFSLSEYQIVAASSIDATMTGGSNDWSIVAGAFKFPSAGGGLLRNARLDGLSSGHSFGNTMEYPHLKNETLARRHLIEQRDKYRKAA